MKVSTARAREASFALDKIFGPRHGFRFANRLPDLQQLKKAFRLQSLRLHPDRARALGRAEALLTRAFQEVNDAYRFLLPFVAPRPPQSGGAAKAARPAGDFFWTAARLPAVPLRFAQFLYYKGLISFNTLIRALVWQAERRPRAGELAVRSRELSREEVNVVLRRKKIHEPFLGAAVRLGFLNEAARRRILAAQKAFALPIGRFFVMEGILSRGRLAALLAECERHNRLVRS